MSEQQDYVALEWVRKEIDATLRDARQAIEAFIEQPEDSSRLQFCLAWLHQVRGTLEMVEFDGAATLARELENLASALYNETAPASEANLATLLQGVLQLPSYLEAVQAGEPDSPVVLLPLINELRAAYGGQLLSELSLFTPNMAAARPSDLPAVAEKVFASDKFIELAKKLRHVYQIALLGILRDQDKVQNLAYIKKVTQRLAGLTSKTPRGQYFVVADALVDGVQAQLLPLSAAIKKQLQQVDKSLKAVVSDPVETMSAFVDDDLMKGLLYHLAGIESDIDSIQWVQQRFQLAGSIPQAESITNARRKLAGPDKEALSSVGNALAEELTQIKAIVDDLRAGTAEDGTASDLEERLTRFADTLSMIGQGRLGRRLREAAELILVADESAYQQIADAVVDAEYALEDLSIDHADRQTAAIDKAQVALIEQASQELDTVKEQLTFYFSSWNINELDGASMRLRSLSRTFNLAALDVPAELAAGLAWVVEHYFTGQPSSEDILNPTADVLVSLEYFCERFEQQDTALHNMLASAQHKLVALGFEPQSAGAPEAQAEPAPSKPATAQAQAIAVEVDDDLIDEDIIEVFLEELEEVQATLAEFYPNVKAQRAHNDDLTTVRRAFHTLKGSGRMVHAVVVGELAWSIENMLNRAIDGSIELDDDVFALIDATLVQLPQLVEDYRAGQQFETPEVQQIQQLAMAKADRQLIDVTALQVTVPVVAEETELAVELPDAEHESAQDVLLSIELDEPAELEEDADIELDEPAVDDGSIEVDLSESFSVADADEVGFDAELNLDEPEASEPDTASEDELTKTFEQELETHLAALENYLAAARASSCADLDDVLLRSLHTIKGAAGMAGREGERRIAGAGERLVKELRDQQADGDWLILEVIADATRLIRRLDQAYQAGEVLAQADVDACVERIESTLEDRLASFALNNDASPSIGLMALFSSDAMTQLIAAEEHLSHWCAEPDLAQLQCFAQELDTLADVALAIDIAPVQQLCEQMGSVMHKAVHIGEPLDPVHSSAVTLSLASLMNILDRLAAGLSIIIDDENLRALEEVDGKLTEMLAPTSVAPVIEDIQAVVEPEPEPEPAVIEDIQAVIEPEPKEASDWFTAQGDPDTLEIFLEEAEELAETIQTHLNEWRQAPDNINILTALQRDLHTFKGGARMAELRPIGDLAHELESLYERLADGRLAVTPDTVKLAAGCQDRLQDMVHDIVERQGCQPAPDLLNALHIEIYGEPFAHAATNTDSDRPVELPAFTSAFLHNLDVTNELLAIFIDEAQSLNKQLFDALQGLLNNQDDLASVDACKRILHTLKGGARVANLGNLGQFYHDLESELVARSSGNRSISADFITALLKEHQIASEAIDNARSQVTADVPDEPQVPAVPAVKSTSKRTGPDLQQVKQAEKRAQPQETVRVQADLLENLVNLAGETSISRARLEEQVSEFGFTLEEMEATISRLREQVRRLDAETEAQVSFRQEQVAEMGQEEFDPLEMDRYSTIQQLSRALLESASDIFDLKASLEDKSRDAETVLVQQSRINTELQEGLMQTRMVPFSRMLPRLRRVVRQIAAELGKQVELQTRNADGELDRQVLERLVAPLEHMLRNAIDHGIEMPHERAAAGKPEMGTITIEIAREGGDVVLNITDDGQGINTQAIRRKAIERGMIDANTELAQEELLQLLMTAGFSTAEAVTQISGRGVGLDVVASEIRQLGGSVELFSEPQIGTNFLLRIPFTVSVNRALMVGIGEELYALPLNTIEGIVRISEEELVAHMKSTGATYTYGGQDYRIRYLGDVLGTGHNPRLDNNGLPLPVVLIKGRHSGDHIAVHVDELLGSREIVVKSIGPQFAQVAGLSGATILGDGRVVVIIDLATLARTEHALLQQEADVAAKSLVQQEASATKARAYSEDEQYTVMVVDDSVTVRKVTSRLLERNGYKAVVAKDGSDALLILQDTVPDLMLLDIEMPRMDGFELATRMRHDERLASVPIIMITSRTGSKHRERALSIGVNEYMGKPFQEAALLENIRKQLAIAETLV